MASATLHSLSCLQERGTGSLATPQVHDRSFSPCFIFTPSALPRPLSESSPPSRWPAPPTSSSSYLPTFPTPVVFPQSQRMHAPSHSGAVPAPPVHLPTPFVRISAPPISPIRSAFPSPSTSPSVPPIARIPVPQLQIHDHWGVAEVLHLYSAPRPAATPSPSPEAGPPPAYASAGPTVAISAAQEEHFSNLKADWAAKKTIKRAAGLKIRTASTPLDVLRVEVKLKVGLESFGW